MFEIAAFYHMTLC